MSPQFVRVDDGDFVALEHVSRLFVLREALETCVVWSAYAQLGNGARIRLRHVAIQKPCDLDDVAAGGDAMREWLAEFVVTISLAFDDVEVVES